jgi:uncharacterized membrane protein (UPF0127 family)
VKMAIPIHGLKKMFRLLFFCLLFSLILCSAETQEKKFVKIFLPDGFAVTAKLAVTDEERQLGLMFREKINPDQGMLFVFEEEGFHSFWMKNMRFSLDILWLDKDKRIVHVERNIPPCKKLPCPSYATQYPAKYVLEIKAGSVDEHKLKMFDGLEFVLKDGDIPE